MSSGDSSREHELAKLVGPFGERDEFSRVLKEIFGTNERAAAIVAAAHVEDGLALAIASRLRPLGGGDRHAVFEGQAAPLNSFHAKIQMGYALNLYEQASREDLSTVKDVRNRFAHNIGVASFYEPTIASLCAKLHFPEHRATMEALTPEEREIETDPRRRFEGVVGQLYFGLALAAENPRRPDGPPAWNGMLNYPVRPKPAPPPSPKTRPVRPSRRSAD